MNTENPVEARKLLKKSYSGETAKEKGGFLMKRICYAVLTVLLLALVVYLICSYIIIAATDTLMAGIVINVPLGEEGQIYLRDIYRTRLSDDRLDKVYLNLLEMEDVATDSNYNDNYYTLVTISEMNRNKELDYLIVDRVGLENLLRKSVFGNLRELLAEEELESMGEDLVYVQQQENTAPIPIAVRISDMPFICQNVEGEASEVFFCIAGGSPRLEQCRDLWEFLLDWEKNNN